MIDQYDFYAWLRHKGRPEEDIELFKKLIDLYLSETYGPDRTGWGEL